MIEGSTKAPDLFGVDSGLPEEAEYLDIRTFFFALYCASSV
jgi:hypothetical protein